LLVRGTFCFPDHLPDSPLHESARLSVPYTPGERVWIDIHYQEGRQDLGVDLQGKRYLRVADLFHLYDPPISYNKVCGWKSIASRDAGNLGHALLGWGTCNW
jgi:hypothetical protein